LTGKILRWLAAQPGEHTHYEVSAGAGCVSAAAPLDVLMRRGWVDRTMIKGTTHYAITPAGQEAVEASSVAVEISW
jgi:hypothetical protein